MNLHGDKERRRLNTLGKAGNGGTGEPIIAEQAGNTQRREVESLKREEKWLHKI